MFHSVVLGIWLTWYVIAHVYLYPDPGVYGGPKYCFFYFKRRWRSVTVWNYRKGITGYLAARVVSAVFQISLVHNVCGIRSPVSYVLCVVPCVHDTANRV